ncbi:hypothetical protein B0T14DRAFT_24963 [Immersiella caudata]|uniref:Uncharacterized protein n=1 Tax=Immersiella caudata TaxID=314043 RepID=A0AA39XE14_9PEZI|nr:hypothetical protein B0T14DRAFT_24963 [Immersiella caudata]
MWNRPKVPELGQMRLRSGPRTSVGLCAALRSLWLSSRYCASFSASAEPIGREPHLLSPTAIQIDRQSIFDVHDVQTLASTVSRYTLVYFLDCGNAAKFCNNYCIACAVSVLSLIFSGSFCGCSTPTVCISCTEHLPQCFRNTPWLAGSGILLNEAIEGGSCYWLAFSAQTMRLFAAVHNPSFVLKGGVVTAPPDLVQVVMAV